LITGGAGFIGSHLSEALLDQGHDVLILDDLSTGSIDNIARLKGRSGFEYFIDTVNNEPLLAELIDRSDVVFHLAAAVGVKLIVEQPVHTIETNVHGTEVVLKHANKKKKLVVIASTSEVYGKSEDVPFREDSDLVLGPTPKHRWAYACSKAIDEFLALAYWKERKLPVIIVRFFNTVGPRQTGQYGMVIPNFVRQALAGEPITVFGDGTQTRPFAHVTDAVEATLPVSSLLFCPTTTAVRDLRNEGIRRGVHRVGDVMMDAVVRNLGRARLGTPCVTLRTTTEWVETLRGGANRLVGADPKRILAAARDIERRRPRPRAATLYGRGRAAEKITEIVVRFLGK